MLHLLRRFGFSRRSTASRATVVAAVTAPLLALSVLGGAPPAEARCVSTGHAVVSEFILGTVVVKEVPQAGTCNGNGLYRGHLELTGTDGSTDHCFSLWVQNNGSWARVAYGCGTEQPTYVYTDDNSRSLLVLCLDSEGVRRCGWGIKWAFDVQGAAPVAGVNEGY